MAEDLATVKQKSRDFFISYASADRRWAEWIAWQLDEAGYSTILQAWDFHAGGNFVLDMDTATRRTERTIAVLSPDYLASRFTPSEWAAAFQRDPKGEQGILLPVRVRPCDVEGLLRQIGYIDLVDQNEQEALTTLLTKVQQQQRSKPVQAPTFPSTSQPDRFPGALPALWMVPFRHNRLFTGRETILLQLHKTLTRGKRVALTQVISGLGGIGKTQIAIEYAYRYFSEYQAVFWMRADSPPSILSSFLEMADLLQLPERKEQDTAYIVSAVQRWYRSHPDWLLIVDNADELDVVQSFLPEGQGQIILTSRSQITRGMADETLPLDVMDADEGALLLLRCAKRVRSGLPLEAISEQERADAKKLVDILGGLPLALDQAGAYIEETGRSVADYLALYQQHHSHLLKQRGTLSKDYPESVATTWFLSFQKVKQRSSVAAELLSFCAFLSPDSIPEEIIAAGAEHLGPLLRTATDPLVLNEAVATLHAYSLVHRDATTHTLNIHRLVQAVLKDQMDEHAKHQWAERVVQAVNAAFPEVKFATWERCRLYLPHALACAALIETYRFTFKEAAGLLSRAGKYLREQGLYGQAEPLFQSALTIREQVLGPEHPDTATSFNDLAWLYREQRQYKQAELLYQRALALCEQALRPEHVGIAATSLYGLAWLYHYQGHYEQAKPLFQRALAIRETNLGPEHPTTAASLSSLASLYREQGHYEQAELLYQRALAMYEKELDPEDPDTATTLNNLAWLYQKQGHYEQAEPLYQRALALREKVRPKHPDTAISLDNLASLYQDQGKYEQAEPLYQRALSIDEHALGPQHPMTQRIRANYALLLRSMGRDAEATALEQELS